jgi:hypothetical protein
MAFIDGRGSRFRIADTGGVIRDLSAFITEVRGLPGDRALNDVTALGDSGARFKPDGEAVTFTLRGLFDDTPAVGADAVLGGLRLHATPTAFEYAPSGFAAGKARYTGECWVKSYELISRAGEPVSWQAMLQVEGKVGRV